MANLTRLLAKSPVKAFACALVLMLFANRPGQSASGQKLTGSSSSTYLKSGVSCEDGVSQSRQRFVSGVSGGAGRAESKSVRGALHSDKAHAGMVWIPAGEFWMGSDEPKFPDARPWHLVRLHGFWIDTTLVTNEQFARFVAATQYVTIAERKPRPEEFPNAPPENLAAGSIVFTPPNHPVPMNNGMQWWSFVKGADWRHPKGPGSSTKNLEKHPVVHIAYADAEAYARWAGKRLPTEAEFEYAERGGLDRKPYAWGTEFKPGGTYMANTFQGHFPEGNTGGDGYVGTSPVASFKPNNYGLYDMSGNVWEWTSDWYRPDYYETLARAHAVSLDPQGPADSFDPSEPGTAKRVHRGGSFLCTDQYCSRYMAGGRGKGEPSTGTNHLGFRLAKDAEERSLKNGE